MYKIQVKKIVCHSNNDFIGDIEVYLMCHADGGTMMRYPPEPAATVDMNDSSKKTWTMSSTEPCVFYFQNSAQVTLYEEDVFFDLGSTDYLGNIYVTRYSFRHCKDVYGTLQMSDGNGNSFDITLKVTEVEAQADA